jgi:hypothetical protein
MPEGTRGERRIGMRDCESRLRPRASRWHPGCDHGSPQLKGASMRPSLVLLVCLMAVVYSATPLLRTSAALDICCAAQADCPSGSRCATGSSPCSNEPEGYCVPVEPVR